MCMSGLSEDGDGDDGGLSLLEDADDEDDEDLVDVLGEDSMVECGW